MENNQEQNQHIVEKVSADLLNDIFASAGIEQKPTETPKEEDVVKSETPLPTPPQEVTPPKVEETEPKQITDYSKKLKSLIKDGIIENFSITVENDGEKQEAFIEDIEDLDEEGYKEIINGWKQAKDEEVKSKYISTEGLDETTKKLIEIRKSGGDISEIIRENVTAIDQLTQLKENIDDEQVQVNIVAHSLQQQGLRPTVIQAQIKALVDEGMLETEANTILDSHLNVHQQAIEQKRQLELQRVEKEKEDLKILRRTLSATYKEIGIPESMQKVLVDNATKLDEDKISNTDKLYFEAQKDPKLFAELNLFLNNREAFSKYLTSGVATKAKIEMTKPLFTLNINKTNKPKLTPNSLVDVADDIINENNRQ